MAASRTLTSALRIAARQVAPVVQKRTLIVAANAARATVAAAPRIASTQQRGLKTIDFAGTKEVVYGMHASPLN